MQLKLAFLDPPHLAPSPSPAAPLATAWQQLDEALQIAALEILARLIAHGRRHQARAPRGGPAHPRQPVAHRPGHGRRRGPLQGSKRSPVEPAQHLYPTNQLSDRPPTRGLWTPRPDRAPWRVPPALATVRESRHENVATGTKSEADAGEQHDAPALRLSVPWNAAHCLPSLRLAAQLACSRQRGFQDWRRPHIDVGFGSKLYRVPPGRAPRKARRPQSDAWRSGHAGTASCRGTSSGAAQRSARRTRRQGLGHSCRPPVRLRRAEHLGAHPAIDKASDENVGRVARRERRAQAPRIL